MQSLTTFAATGEFERARALLDALGLAFEVVSPEPA